MAFTNLKASPPHPNSWLAEKEKLSKGFLYSRQRQQLPRTGSWMDSKNYNRPAVARSKDLGRIKIPNFFIDKGSSPSKYLIYRLFSVSSWAILPAARLRAGQVTHQEG